MEKRKNNEFQIVNVSTGENSPSVQLDLTYWTFSLSVRNSLMSLSYKNKTFDRYES